MNHDTKEQTTTLTPLASAAQAAGASSTAPPRHREQHRQVNWLRDVILGGQDTLLRGAVADQAALHGVLAQIEALGLELLEVRRLSYEPKRGAR
jgi:hypothetical protein